MSLKQTVITRMLKTCTKAQINLKIVTNIELVW
jgi:hypothetical protein